MFVVGLRCMEGEVRAFVYEGGKAELKDSKVMSNFNALNRTEVMFREAGINGRIFL